MGIPPYFPGILRWKVISQWNILGHFHSEALVEQRTPSTHLIFDAWSSVEIPKPQYRVVPPTD